MDCSLLYPSPFDTNPYSLHYVPNENIHSYGLEYIPYDNLCLSNFNFRSHLVPEPPTPSFSEPSIVSTLTTSSSTPRKRKRTNQSQDSDDSSAKSQKREHPSKANASLEAVSALESDLGYLQDSWASIHIVLDSLQNAFLVTPVEGASEQQLDELDRELGTAYDDLMIQVRQLDRALKQLDRKINELQSASQVDR
ncbi:hypothetical protein Unana1_07214 [Umbelopsis nana]